MELAHTPPTETHVKVKHSTHVMGVKWFVN